MKRTLFFILVLALACAFLCLGDCGCYKPLSPAQDVEYTITRCVDRLTPLLDDPNLRDDQRSRIYKSIQELNALAERRGEL